MSAGTADREIVITRTIQASPELVWEAWTDPTQIARWWGPDGFTTTTHSMDMRASGEWRFDMHGPDGRDYPNRIVYDEVVKPKRLVYRHTGDEDVEPVAFNVTVTFEQQGDGTRLTLRMVFPTADERDRVQREYGAVEGGIQTVGRLADYLAERTGQGRASLTLALPTDRQIILSRTFNAPRAIVFEAMSKPEHIRKWWGPKELEVIECSMDFRPGGSWRIVQRGPDGTEHPFKGEYKEITAPERIVMTFIYDVEGFREHAALETMTLEEREGKTVYTSTILHDSAESRDGHLSSGMEAGAVESLDRLAELISTLAKGSGS